MSNGGSLNRRILNYIDELAKTEEARKFLKWAIGFELERVMENNPQFRREYERKIIELIKKRKEDL